MHTRIGWVIVGALPWEKGCTTTGTSTDAVGRLSARVSCVQTDRVLASGDHSAVGRSICFLAVDLPLAADGLYDITNTLANITEDTPNVCGARASPTSEPAVKAFSNHEGHSHHSSQANMDSINDSNPSVRVNSTDATELNPDAPCFHSTHERDTTDKLDPHLPCSRSTFGRDTTKLALLEFPAVNPISVLLCEPESELVTDNTHAPGNTQTLDIDINTLSPEQNSSGVNCI